jgi:hypothetical protein
LSVSKIGVKFLRVSPCDFGQRMDVQFFPPFCPKKIQGASKMDISDVIETMVNEPNCISPFLFGLIGDDSCEEK